MANKKPNPPKSSPRSGGALMGMRSGFQKMTGAKLSKRSPWSFQQVLMAVAGFAAVVALVYAMSR
jgi:hypothetical protein